MFISPISMVNSNYSNSSKQSFGALNVQKMAQGLYSTEQLQKEADKLIADLKRLSADDIYGKVRIHNSIVETFNVILDRVKNIDELRAITEAFGKIDKNCVGLGPLREMTEKLIRRTSQIPHVETADIQKLNSVLGNTQVSCTSITRTRLEELNKGMFRLL